MKFLIASGANVNTKAKNGATPLMFASAFDNCSVLKVLIEKGADVNAKDNGGWSALIYAAYNGNFAFDYFCKGERLVTSDSESSHHGQ